MDHEHPLQTKVFLMSAQPLLLAGMAAALGGRAGLSVSASAPRGLPLDGAAVAHDVVVTDYDDGIRLALQRDAADASSPRILVVTLQDREHEVRRAVECGVDGYLLLDCELSELVRGVQTLAQGRRYLSASISQQVADSFTREPLTARESQVLGLLAEGLCNKMIGRELAIQAGTVKSHVKGILTKLEAASRTQAVSIAARRGLVSQRLHRSGIGSQLHPGQRHAQVH